MMSLETEGRSTVARLTKLNSQILSREKIINFRESISSTSDFWALILISFSSYEYLFSPLLSHFIVRNFLFYWIKNEKWFKRTKIRPARMCWRCCTMVVVVLFIINSMLECSNVPFSIIYFHHRRRSTVSRVFSSWYREIHLLISIHAPPQTFFLFIELQIFFIAHQLSSLR